MLDGAGGRRALERALVRRPPKRCSARFQQQFSALITEVVQRWDAEMISEKIETELGPDLQFIRLNGSLVGGAAGVVLHAALVVGGAALAAARRRRSRTGRVRANGVNVPSRLREPVGDRPQHGGVRAEADVAGADHFDVLRCARSFSAPKTRQLTIPSTFDQIDVEGIGRSLADRVELVRELSRCPTGLRR